MRYSTVLTYLYSGQEWSLSDENYDTLNWFSDTPKPTKDELDAQVKKVQEIIEAEKQSKIDAKARAEAKLATLGLTLDDLRALGIQHNLYR